MPVAPITNPSFKCCCPTDLPPVTSDYTGRGRFVEVNGVKCYVVTNGTDSLEPTKNRVTVMAIYDIFGFHGNTRHFCDVLSTSIEGGCRVIMPDVFQGETWSFAKYTPEFRSELVAWVEERGNDEIALSMSHRILPAFLKNEFTPEQMAASSEAAVDARLQLMPSAKGYLQSTERASAETELAALAFSTRQILMTTGFCFGAAKSFRFAHNGDLYKAVGAYHPSFFHAELVAGVKCPALVINTMEDPEHLDLKEIMEKGEYGPELEWDHWRDVHHGFCSARGNYDDPLVRARAEEAMKRTVVKFNAIIKRETAKFDSLPSFIGDKLSAPAMLSTSTHHGSEAMNVSLTQ